MTQPTNLERFLESTEGAWFSVETLPGIQLATNDHGEAEAFAESIRSHYPAIVPWQDGRPHRQSGGDMPHTRAALFGGCH